MRRTLRGIALAVLLAGTALTAVRVAHAQQPTTVLPGQAVIWTDRGVYNVGDSIQYCYRVPITGLVTITDFPANGNSNVIFNRQVLSTQDCIDGVVTPPAGRECLTLSYPNFGGRGQTQTCFTVLGANPPDPSLEIFLSNSVFRVGSPITVCY